MLIYNYLRPIFGYDLSIHDRNRSVKQIVRIYIIPKKLSLEIRLNTSYMTETAYT